MAESSPRMPQELLSDANQGIIRGPKPLQQHASHKAGMDIIGSSQQAVAALDKSPVKSPSKARRQLPVLSVDTARQLDDEDDAPDSTPKTTPIARGSRSRASILDSSPGGSLIPTSPAAAATTGPPSPPVVSRLPGSAGISSSGSASCIAASPSKRPDWRMPAKPVGQDAAANAAGPAAAAGSPARRSLAAPAAAATRPQYAFGSRIEAPAAASTRKPSPMRQSAPGAVRHVSSSSPSGPSPGSAAARAYASPQRVPAAARSAGGLPAAATGRAGASPQRVPAGARSSATATGTAAMRAAVSPQRVPAAARSAAAASAAMRSTSAPRMSADKLQSRFAQHQEDNSCTPLVALPLPPGKAGAAAKLEQESSSSSVASPFLGRISNMSAVASPAGPTTLPAHKQQQAAAAAAQCTPQQQRRSLLPMHPAPGTPIPPAPAGTPAGNAANVRLPDVDFSSTPLVAGKHSAGSVASAVAAAAAGDMAPPLLPREVSGASLAYGDGSLSREASRDVTRETSMHALHGAAGLSREGSAVSIDSAAVAVAAKGLMLPLHRLEEEEASAQFASPPRHRRGEHSSPKGAAAVCSQLLKSKASSVCGGSGSKPTPAEAAVADDAAATPAAAQQQQRTNKGSMPTPASSSPSKALRFTPGSDSKLRSSLAKVPRLDLTPVLAQAEEDQQLEEEQQQQLQLEQESQEQQLAEEQQHEQQLLLEFSGHAEEQAHRSRARAGAHDGKPESASSGAGKRGTSAGRRAAGSGSGKRSAAAEPPQQPVFFYVYESVMPAEETKTYEELRRALLKSHGGHRLAANLQGIWGCYQDARRNTEAMAFRGHRLLDQVSNEYKHYKSEAEQHLEQLQQERDAYKEELQLALTTGHGSGMDVEVAKDKQVQELRHENQQLRLQMAEMEKALHKAAEFHHAQQAEAVPNQARTIAGSATTSILFQQTLALQEELMAKEKTIEDLKAGLMITCGALKQTNYMEPEGAVRAGFEPDTVQVLDMMISSTAAEASMLDQVHAAAAAAAEAVQPHTQIEELH
ncbi:hypothetical protein OEZ85_011549 [Tetradesmus obliquus]|uniref:Uncharacterized protein n=1 Tax=Tetradesmus obliquus TaxID=3088 RepID=A0ABY8TSZ3_TETOB|nr:hypothetical protein OEZ85_011549 [Tetradesmus obliquus]